MSRKTLILLGLIQCLSSVGKAARDVGPVLPEDFKASEVIEVRFVNAVPSKSGKDPKWNLAPIRKVMLYPQTTVQLNDKNVNGRLSQVQPLELKVRALYSAKEVGVLLEWQDDTKNLVSSTETNVFADAVAVEIPKKITSEQRLPYVGMGDEKNPVHLYLAQALAKGEKSRALTAQGFGTSGPGPSGRFSFRMEYEVKGKVWRAFWIRPLVSSENSLAQGLVPIAFAIWNGDGGERGGNKSLSAWKYLRMEKYKVSEARLKTATFGFGKGDLGDPAKGKALALATCTGCHRLGDVRTAPRDLAPDLSSVGAISSFSYLRDSILEPNEVVVKNLNLSRHHSMTAPKDERGTHPDNEAFSWYTREQGQLVSKMPKLTNLTGADVADLVAFLKTLK